MADIAFLLIIFFMVTINFEVDKTQVYLPPESLKALHRLASDTGRSVADLVREAIQRVWLQPESDGPVALWTGPFAGSSADHDAAFDEL